MQLTIGGQRLVVEGLIGQGTTSLVYRCRSEPGGELLALKVARRPSDNVLLADEAERLLWAQSHALPKLLAVGRLRVSKRGTSTEPAIAQDAGALLLSWVEGRTLRHRLTQGSNLSEREILYVAYQIAAALRDLHAAGTSHGDVKPENVIVSQTGDALCVTLLDLGLGAVANDAMPRGGTRRYLPPEVTQNPSDGDGRKRDLWALGLLLAEIAVEASGALQPEELVQRIDPASVLGEITSALLSNCPGARPSAGWVENRARIALSLEVLPEQTRIERESRIRRAYLRAHKSDIIALATAPESRVCLSGIAAQWVQSTSAMLAAIYALNRSPFVGNETIFVTDLDGASKLRFLVDLIGPVAASWPLYEVCTDDVLLERMLGLCESVDPYAFTLAQLSEPLQPSPATKRLDAVELSLLLWDGLPRKDVLEAAEAFVAMGQSPPAFRLALARRLRSLGQLGRALAVLAKGDEAMLVAESAETARRAGDVEGAIRRLRSLDNCTESNVRSRAAATEARILLDRRSYDAAANRLRGATETASLLEVRALLELALDRKVEAQATLSRAQVLAAGDEERARVEALIGMLHHAEQKASLAVDSFRRAVEHASRAGSVLEEATYLTGLSAAAVDACRVDEAILAAERATALFEALGRPNDAARAALNRVAALAAVGATAQAKAAGDVALALARQAKDEQCAAYIHLELADVLEGDRDGKEHAMFALRLLSSAGTFERLMASARAYEHGLAVDVADCDAIARKSTDNPAASLDWWGARCRVALAKSDLHDASMLVGQVGQLLNANIASVRRGRAVAAGVALALLAQLGDAARRLAVIATSDAQSLIANCPAELRPALLNRAWIRALRMPVESLLLPEQIADIESLVRALGREDELRSLLVQVLDALVLWTGVERGLLLLLAPGGRLVARVGRNLSRRDLVGHQLTLSHSLANQALAQGEPIVAVDASGELDSVHESVHALKLRSVLAVPLIARGESFGVVYLDDRIRRGAFGPKELAWVRLVGAVAAVAIADARDRLRLRRAARRAERAERRTTEQLASREAELGQARVELARTRDIAPTRYRYDGMIGDSQAMRDLFRLVDRVVAADVPVLVLGESGSGKELIARAIHQNGARSKAAFVAENCGALPEPLLESTLFGHVKGAFTGASRARAGLFEVAHEGTLFLDEVAEMSLGMQTKLLRVLEDGEFWSVGAERPKRVDVRVIAATHRDLLAMVADGRFRQDLFYRMNVVAVRMPPLRERHGDIPLLVSHFLKQYAKGRTIEVTREALELLCRYPWPGNVRQLENELRRAIVLSDSTIGPDELSEELRRVAMESRPRPVGLDLRSHIEGIERQLVGMALERTTGNQTRAAELLGVSRFGLQKMLRRLDIRACDPQGETPSNSASRASILNGRVRAGT